MVRKFSRLRILGLFPVLILALAWTALAGEDCTQVYGQGSQKLTLATGSPGELGLLKALSEEFLKGRDASLCWRKAGSGASLKLLKTKKADLIMVHAPAAEKAAVAEGWAAKRSLIGSNEFYVVGPKEDPAGIAKAENAAQAYALIAKAQAPFITRGDNSGTHKKELAIWKKAGIQPSGQWYVVTKDFMMASLQKADQIKGYFMTDSSTWVKGRGLHGLANLEILFKGDPFLINTYHALCQPKGGTPLAGMGAELIDFMISAKGQEIIGTFGQKEFGAPLYRDAEYAKQHDH